MVIELQVIDDHVDAIHYKVREEGVVVKKASISPSEHMGMQKMFWACGSAQRKAQNTGWTCERLKNRSVSTFCDIGDGLTAFRRPSQRLSKTEIQC
jgi:hypothetical protein